MSFLNRMYGKNRPAQTQEQSSTKNPNRVVGGLKAQNADSLTMVNEDGSETQVPTQRYVDAMHEQIRKQKAAIDVLEKKLYRLSRESESMKNAINSVYKK